jgi:uncharacterized protein
MAANGIRQRVEETPFVDTHEHLREESLRLASLDAPAIAGMAAPDFGMLFSHYTDSDLIVSGMPLKDWQAVTGYGLSPKEKWKLVAPYYERTRHTGYMQCARESARLLYGVDDIREDTVETISEQLRAQVKPGFYETILKTVCRIKYCQVNSLEGAAFRETAQPALLMQDLSTIPLCMHPDINGLSKKSGIEVHSLKDWRNVIDWVFAEYGPRAIATKNQAAYERALDYAPVKEEDAAPLFARLLGDAEPLKPEELKAVRDHLFHYCIEKATEYDLTVKLHTGYYAGHGHMDLHRVRNNGGDVSRLLMMYPETRFDFFHIDYPYQDEMIALAKHFPNAYIDMCWVWIINPLASVRFLKEFLMAAPSNKVFTFGGDYMPVELVPGHAALARQGIAQALNELVSEGWINASEVDALIPKLMYGNAEAVFDYDRRLAAWKNDGA